MKKKISKNDANSSGLPEKKYFVMLNNFFLRCVEKKEQESMRVRRKKERDRATIYDFLIRKHEKKEYIWTASYKAVAAA